MRTINKYLLPEGGRVTIQMPEGAEILTVQAQYDWGWETSLWVAALPDNRPAARTFHVLYAECAIPSAASKYIGTVQTGDVLVYHVFEVVE